MKMRSVMPMRIAKVGSIVMSVLFCMTGILCIVWPEASGLSVGIVAGSVLTAFGVIKLIGYFSRDLFRLAFQFDLETGILMLLLGMVILWRPDRLLPAMCVALGAIILLDGLFKIRISIDAKRFGIERWWVILVMAGIAVAMGAALMLNAATGAKLLTVLLGLSLVSEGILNLCTVVSTVRIVRNQMPDDGTREVYEMRGEDILW